ncbi:MAG TPA: amidohydrolase family protein [Armatimonadota bacterium]|nr:amidohydrolase family protein [Armatimonadota bacterium]
MIDIHLHVGRLYLEPPLRPSYLLNFMDRHGIEKAALLPMENPEQTYFYVTTAEVLRVCRRHPDRFIPFCNVDPRRWAGDRSTDFASVLNEYRERGCRGFGEGICGLPIDDPRLCAIYEICGRLGMPVILDLTAQTNIDEQGLPRFEKMLRDLPATVFLGHGAHFWAEISGDVTPRDFSAYPGGKVAAGGAAPRLLERHPNLYGDLSANSGYNALTRDPEFGYRFLEAFQGKLILGTDLCHAGQQAPIIPYLKDALAQGRISRAAFDQITRTNAERILGL